MANQTKVCLLLFIYAFNFYLPLIESYMFSLMQNNFK